MTHIARVGYIIAPNGLLLGAAAYVDEEDFVVRTPYPVPDVKSNRDAIMQDLAEAVAVAAMQADTARRVIGVLSPSEAKP